MPTVAYDEMQMADGAIRSQYRFFAEWLDRTPPDRIKQKRGEAERAFHRLGITFAVYGEGAGTERLIPFDIIPRILPADQWQLLEAGLRQRVTALNMFLNDVYHGCDIVRAGVIAEER